MYYTIIIIGNTFISIFCFINLQTHCSFILVSTTYPYIDVFLFTNIYLLIIFQIFWIRAFDQINILKFWHALIGYHAANLRWFSLIPSRIKNRIAIIAKKIEIQVMEVLEHFIIAYETSVRRSNTDNLVLNTDDSSFFNRI